LIIHDIDSSGHFPQIIEGEEPFEAEIGPHDQHNLKDGEGLNGGNSFVTEDVQSRRTVDHPDGLHSVPLSVVCIMASKLRQSKHFGSEYARRRRQGTFQLRMFNSLCVVIHEKSSGAEISGSGYMS
jgi:hypothetical protein